MDLDKGAFTLVGNDWSLDKTTYAHELHDIDMAFAHTFGEHDTFSFFSMYLEIIMV